MTDMTEKEIREMMQRFYSLYCNCLMRDERKLYLEIYNKLEALLDLNKYTHNNSQE